MSLALFAQNPLRCCRAVCVLIKLCLHIININSAVTSYISSPSPLDMALPECSIHHISGPLYQDLGATIKTELDQKPPDMSEACIVAMDNPFPHPRRCFPGVSEQENHGFVLVCCKEATNIKHIGHVCHGLRCCCHIVADIAVVALTYSPPSSSPSTACSSHVPMCAC